MLTPKNLLTLVMRIESISVSMKRFLFSLFFLLTVLWLQAQELIPQNYRLKTKEDFQQYESTVKSCMEWLIRTPRSENTAKRIAVEEFTVKWIKDTPYLTVVIEPYVMKLAKKNPDLLLTFMFGYTAYQLQHPENKALLTPHVAGLENLAKDYTLNKATFKEDEKIEEILELQKKGEISAWVKTQLSQPELEN